MTSAARLAVGLVLAALVALTLAARLLANGSRSPGSKTTSVFAFSSSSAQQFFLLERGAQLESHYPLSSVACGGAVE